MDLLDRIVVYVNGAICADVREIANEVYCSQAVALKVLKSNPHMFWQSKDKVWFVVGEAASATVKE